MGSFNVACSISNISISGGDKIYFLPLLSNTGSKQVLTPFRYSPYSDFKPFSFPIKGVYNDYGRMEDIERNVNTNCIESFLGITIEQFIAIVTDNRVFYDDLSAIFDVFFKRKELMEYEVSFEDCAKGLGFTHCGDIYISPDKKYSFKEEEYGLKPIEKTIPDYEGMYGDKK
jgi:hypothetical protein